MNAFLFFFACLAGSFRVLFAFRGYSRTSHLSSVRLQMVSTGVAVIGVAGGAAETVAVRLAEKGYNVCSVLDRKPYSPELLRFCQADKVDVYVGEVDKELTNLVKGSKAVSSLDRILEGRQVVIIGDEGSETLRGKRDDTNEGAVILQKLSKQLPTTAKSIICSVSAALDKEAQGSFFGPKGSTVFKEWSTKNQKPFSLLRYGSLIGGVPGAEPLPFVGLPSQEPELDPSYVLRSVVLGDLTSNKYATEEVCTRDALSESVVQLIERGINVESLVVSIAGNPPSENDWSKLFNRFTATGNVEILRIDFGSLSKPQAMANWIVDVWFPQALIDADAATILSGARPVRATKVAPGGTTQAVRIVWEDLQPDLSVKAAGAVEVRLIEGESPALSVVRLSSGMLQGETLLMDKLLEAVNKFAYKKQYCTPV